MTGTPAEPLNYSVLHHATLFGATPAPHSRANVSHVGSLGMPTLSFCLPDTKTQNFPPPAPFLNTIRKQGKYGKMGGNG